MGAARIDGLFDALLGAGGSDLHLGVGYPPLMRVRGDLTAMREKVVDPQEMESLLFEITTPEQKKTIVETLDLDFAYAYGDKARFRANYFYKTSGLAAVFRTIPTRVLTLDELRCPPVLRKLSDRRSGLVLVTGPTGSGKSTTLAAMIDDINTREKGHILTIEDPIEFVHLRKSCLISQREIGVHSPSFASAVHSALREDPDVILVGELRDLETMSIAVTAAEMGILVMGTLHTNGAAQTVDRMVNVFPSDKQSHVRTMLSTSLRGVISQQLLQRSDKQGRVVALEILVNTPAAANLIRQGKLDQLENTMQAGGAFGMRTMDSAIEQLLNQRQITGAEAFKKAINKSRFEEFRGTG